MKADKQHSALEVIKNDGMDSPRFCAASWCPLVFIIWGEGSTKQSQGESEMNATTVAVDLAKDVFQLAVADADWRVVQTAPAKPQPVRGLVSEPRG